MANHKGNDSSPFLRDISVIRSAMAAERKLRVACVDLLSIHYTRVGYLKLAYKIEWDGGRPHKRLLIVTSL